LPKISSTNKLSTALPFAYKVGEAIVEQLRLWGIKRVYGVVGDAIFGFLDAIAQQEDIQFISVKHESVAAMMASAEGKMTDGIAVCTAQMGPGLANLMVGLGDAYMDNVPMLVITGQAPTNKIGTPYKQYINQQEMVQSITLGSELIVHPDAVIGGLSEALYASLSQRSVSHLSIPTDIFHLVTTTEPKKPPRVSTSSSGQGEMEQALEIMRSARKPIVLVGCNVRIHSHALQSLAEAWGCGIAMSYGAIGIIPDSHPLLLNGLGEGGNPFLPDLFKKSDVVLALETDWWPQHLVPRSVRVVQLAKQRELFGMSLPMDIGLIGDYTAIVTQLTEKLTNHTPSPGWLEEIQYCKQAWSIQNEKEGCQSGAPCHPSSIIRTIEQNVDDDAIITLDEGDSTLWFLRNFRGKQQRVLLSKSWRTMGFGLPAAMAAKLCFPEKQVVCITGDGGLGMVMADLLTATRYGLVITLVVFQNDTLQMEKDKMFMKGLQPLGTNLTNPDFIKIANACGWDGYQINSIEQLNEALQRSRRRDKPVLLSVSTAQVPFPNFQ